MQTFLQSQFCPVKKSDNDPWHAREVVQHVAAFLDAYFERCVKSAGLRSVHTVRSQISVLKEYLGSLPVAAIEEPDDVNRFKGDYGEHVEIASVHRVLERLRAAINWGMAQTPPRPLRLTSPG